MSEYSIWLLPSAEHEPGLAETIARLSVLMGGARFEAHVTIQGDLSLPREKLSRHLRQLAATTPAQRWRVRGVAADDHFFRCLFLQFGAQPAFDELNTSVARFTETTGGLPPHPHLSLAYGQAHPDNDKLCQVLATQFEGQEIVFDRQIGRAHV